MTIIKDFVHGDPTATLYRALYLRCGVCTACGAVRAEWPIRRCVGASVPRCCLQFHDATTNDRTSCSTTRASLLLFIRCTRTCRTCCSFNVARCTLMLHAARGLDALVRARASATCSSATSVRVTCKLDYPRVPSSTLDYPSSTPECCIGRGNRNRSAKPPRRRACCRCSKSSTSTRTRQASSAP